MTLTPYGKISFFIKLSSSASVCGVIVLECCHLHAADAKTGMSFLFVTLAKLNNICQSEVSVDVHDQSKLVQKIGLFDKPVPFIICVVSVVH